MFKFIAFVIAVAAAIWVYNDAAKRGLSSGKSLAWALGTLFAVIIVLPLYLIMRPSDQRLPPPQDRISGPGS
jgi:hypothetical protein